MKTYTRQEYCDKFGMHRNTLAARIKNNLLPSFHKVVPVNDRGDIIIISDECERCSVTEKLIEEYMKLANVVVKPTLEQKQFAREIAAELSIKYQVNTVKLFKILGL